MKHGFTLIELLVVIAIMAILAAILFPVFARARSKARSAACLSNCKQLGLGLMMYLQDHDGMYPQNEPHGAADVSAKWWSGRIYPYVKNRELYVCPGRREQYIGYSINYRLSGWSAGIDEERIGFPASTVVLADTEPTHKYTPGRSVGTNPDWILHAPYDTTIYTWCPPFPRHNDGANLVLADGHAKWYRVEQTWDEPANTSMYTLNNKHH